MQAWLILQSISLSIIVQCNESCKSTTVICVSVTQPWGFFTLICSDMLQTCYYSQKKEVCTKRRFQWISSAIIKTSQKYITSIHLHDPLKNSLTFLPKSTVLPHYLFQIFTLKLKYNLLLCPQHIANYTPNTKYLASVFSPLPLCSLQHFTLYNWMHTNIKAAMYVRKAINLTCHTRFIPEKNM